MTPLFFTWLQRIGQDLARRKQQRQSTEVPCSAAKCRFILARRELLAAELARDTRRIHAAHAEVVRAKTHWLEVEYSDSQATQARANRRGVRV